MDILKYAKRQQRAMEKERAACGEAHLNDIKMWHWHDGCVCAYRDIIKQIEEAERALIGGNLP